MPFSPDQIEGRSYEAESSAFITAHGCTPRDAIRTSTDRERHSSEVIEQAQFLDAWDLWLFGDGAKR